jgi:hypothetical protein
MCNCMQAHIHTEFRWCCFTPNCLKTRGPFWSYVKSTAEFTSVGRWLARYHLLDPFPSTPRQTGRATFTASGFPVRSVRSLLSRRLTDMNSLMTETTHHQGLPSACCHDFDPSWSLFSLFVKVCKFVNVVNFYVFPRFA